MKIPITNILILLLYLFHLSGCSNAIKELKFEIVPIEAVPRTDLNDSYIESKHVLHIPGYYVWGGSVIKGEDNHYHMIFSIWANDTTKAFSETWVLESSLGYAVSQYPDRDYQFKGIFMRGRKYSGDSLAWDAEMVHNPHLKSFNGKYYLYYIGSRDPGERQMGDPGNTLTKRNRIQQVQKIGVIEFESFEELLEGQFTRPTHSILSPRTRVKTSNVIDPSPKGTKQLPDNLIVVNPGVIYDPLRERYLLYFKGNKYDPNWKGVHGVALSKNPNGPFKALDNYVFEVLDESGKLSSAEDPYVWFHKKNNKYYALIKDFSGRITGENPGLALMESPDGINWAKTKTGIYLKKEIKTSDGIIKVGNLERPQLLISDEGIPLVLFAACSLEGVGKNSSNSTFNIHLPIRIIE